MQFFPVTHVYFDLTVPKRSVQYNKHCHLFRAVDAFVYTREGVLIVNHYGVQLAVVGAKARYTILLVDEQNKSCVFGNRQFDRVSNEQSVYLWG